MQMMNVCCFFRLVYQHTAAQRWQFGFGVVLSACLKMSLFLVGTWFHFYLSGELAGSLGSNRVE